MRKRLSYANVAATLALVFSMTGGAMAANHYLISSTKQIKPSILKKLKGNAGAKGATGPQGPQGAQGGAGPAGPAGSAVAFAHILGATEPTKVLDSANSKNVTAASQSTAGPGVYCLAVSVPFNTITATADLLSGGATTVTANTSLAQFEVEVGKVCPVGTNVIVETEDGGTATNSNFWITFD